LGIKRPTLTSKIARIIIAKFLIFARMIIAKLLIKNATMGHPTLV